MNEDNTFIPQDNYTRCSYCQTILIEQAITVRVSQGTPAQIIAKTWLCNKCGDTPRRWIIQGHYIQGMNGGREYIESAPERLKITKAMIINAMAERPKCYHFELSEIKNAPAATVTKPTRPVYNANAYTEPSDEKIF